jgi:hypothetical protein
MTTVKPKQQRYASPTVHQQRKDDAPQHARQELASFHSIARPARMGA